MANTTAKLIKKHRKSKKLDQGALADELKTTKQFISLLENGHSKPPLYALRTISKTLGIKRRELANALIKDYATKVEAALYER